MKIDLISKKDFEDFLKIKKQFNYEYGISKKNKEFILKEFQEYLKKGLILAAKKDGLIIGYICGQIEENLYEKVAYISEIFVLKEYRGNCLASLIKDKFLEILKLKKIKICRIDVSLNNPAKQVYQKWGFKTDKIRMSLDLK